MDTDTLQTFQSVCGTDEDTATHVLESFGGDLDRAVNFFMENGEQGVATLQSFRPPEPPPASAPPAPIDLEEDDDGPIVVSSQSPDQHQAAGNEAADQHGRNQGWLEEEAALQEALEASKVTAPGSTRSGAAQGTSTPGRPSSAHRSASEQTAGSSDVEEYEPDYDSDVEMDTEEEYAAKLAAAQQAQAARLRRRQGGDGAGPSGAAAAAFFDGLSDNAGPRIRGSRPSGAAAAASQQLQDLNAFSQRLGIPMPPPLPGMAGLPSRPPGLVDDEDGEFEDGAGPSGLGMPGGAGPFGAAFGGGHDAGLPDMPAGVDLEEARMLEAAMLGIPYAGRLPDFGVNGAAPPGGGGFGGAAAQPLSPGVHHTRALREEQDWAFQASLQADREKAEAEERAQREAEQESARMAAAAQAAAAAAAKAEAHRAQTLADKAAALPPEPASGAADTVAVLIRLPNGQRLTRRFLKTDKLQTLYDFVDTSEPGEEWPHGSYLLVTSRPRKVYEETAEQTLADAGLIQKQEMLLLEPKG